MDSNTMHYIFLFSFFLVLLFPQSFSQNKKIKRYLFENAYIEKTSTVISPAMESTTTEKIYITEWGNKEAHYKNEIRNIKMMNKKEESKSVSIVDGNWLINYDPDKKKGTKMKNPFYDKFAGKSEKELKDFSKNLSDAFGIDVKKVGTEKILGKTCDVMEGKTDLGGIKSKSKMWVYKSFPLKTDTEAMGTKTSEVAKVFKEDFSPDGKFFIVPKNIKLTELKIPTKNK